MGDTPSATDENLILLEGLESFANHTENLISESNRQLYILSKTLDYPIYNQNEVVSAVSKLARTDRHASIKILVKESRPLVEKNHSLLLLSRRLPSKIQIRKLSIEPEDDDRSYIIGDNDRLLYRHDERDYAGFVNYRAGPEVKSLLENFQYLWQQHSLEDVDLRSLSL